MASYPKCATCGRPLPIKPDPVVTNQPAHSPRFYANVVIVTLAIWVGFMTIIGVWGCK